jgi:hypothetical protein
LKFCSGLGDENRHVSFHSFGGVPIAQTIPS